jgi:hypothetical protein
MQFIKISCNCRRESCSCCFKAPPNELHPKHPSRLVQLNGVGTMSAIKAHTHPKFYADLILAPALAFLGGGGGGGDGGGSGWQIDGSKCIVAI